MKPGVQLAAFGDVAQTLEPAPKGLLILQVQGRNEILPLRQLNLCFQQMAQGLSWVSHCITPEQPGAQSQLAQTCLYSQTSQVPSKGCL